MVIDVGELLYKRGHICGNNCPVNFLDTHLPCNGHIQNFSTHSLGTATLLHCVVIGPLARCRGNSKHTPTDLVVEHYATRANVPGTLIISEATFIAHKAFSNSFHAHGIPDLIRRADHRVEEGTVYPFLRLSEYVQLYATAARTAVGPRR